jgi:hypothetical protein
MELLKQTVYLNLDIPVHYYAQVDWQGFIDIIDAVGGVEMDVACALPELELEPGMHFLTGEQALYFVQTRETSDDYDRGRRQRKMLAALKQQALTQDIIPKLPGLWRSLSGSIETDLPLGQFLSLATYGLQLKDSRILSSDIDASLVKNHTTPGGQMVLLPRENELRAFLEEFYGPVPPKTLDAPAKVRVQVSSATSLRDADRLAAAALKRAGFKVRTGSTDLQNLRWSEIIVYKGDPGAAERLAKKLDIPLSAIQDETNIPEPPNRSSPIDIRVILGQDYDPCPR